MAPKRGGRRCRACEATEKQICQWCARRYFAARCVGNSADPDLQIGEFCLDRMFWIEAAGFVLREKFRVASRADGRDR